MKDVLCFSIFHLMVNLIFNFTILRDIERMSGWYRTGVIFIFSGMGGNLWCAVVAPYEPEVPRPHFVTTILSQHF